MVVIKKIVYAIDRFNGCMGWIFAWLVVYLGLLVTIAVVRRFWFNAPTIWAFTICAWLYGALFMLTSAYAHLHKSHVRIDILYAFLPPKVQTILDLLTYLVFFFPFFVMLTATGTHFAAAAWTLAEHKQGLFSPHMGPIKTVIPVASAMLLLQGVSDFIKKTVFLIKGDKL